MWQKNQKKKGTDQKFQKQKDKGASEIRHGERRKFDVTIVRSMGTLLMSSTLMLIKRIQEVMKSG